jgi:hypothetical protein
MVEFADFNRDEEECPMTEDRLLIEELAAKGGQPDFLRTIAENVLQLIIEADVDGLIGAGRHERSGDRATWRNGYRDRSLDTRGGTRDVITHQAYGRGCSDLFAQALADLINGADRCASGRRRDLYQTRRADRGPQGPGLCARHNQAQDGHGVQGAGDCQDFRVRAGG